MMKIVTLNDQKVQVDLDGDGYGEAFWERVSKKTYEPDTLCFVERECGNRVDFMDIGAANGAITLFAASRGARVTAYEPDPRMYKVVNRNLSLNPMLLPLVQLKNEAVSSEPTRLKFAQGEDDSILSSIVFGDYVSRESLNINIASLSKEMDMFHHDFSRKLILKMDIEGAEWKILRSRETLACLKRHRATLLLAVHPGFVRPFNTRNSFFRRIRNRWWHMKNYLESLVCFDLIVSFATVRRTNLNEVKLRHQFALLILAGYHEFIIEFE